MEGKGKSGKNNKYKTSKSISSNQIKQKFDRNLHQDDNQSLKQILNSASHYAQQSMIKSKFSQKQLKVSKSRKRRNSNLRAKNQSNNFNGAAFNGQTALQEQFQRKVLLNTTSLYDDRGIQDSELNQQITSMRPDTSRQISNYEITLNINLNQINVDNQSKGVLVVREESISLNNSSDSRNTGSSSDSSSSLSSGQRRKNTEAKQELEKKEIQD